MISVIMPAFNAAPYIQEALASIAAQDWDDLEILVVDDHSTDETAAIASLFPRTRVLALEEKTGPAAARNLGMQQARGKYLAFLDADDRWPRDKLKTHMGAMRRQGDQGIVMGRTRVFSHGGAPMRNLPFENEDHELVLFSFGSTMLERRVLETVGFIDQTLRYGEDGDFMFRLLESDWPLLVLRNLSQEYRLHSANMTNGMDLGRLTLPPVLLRQAKRHRATPGLRARSLGEVDELSQPKISAIVPAFQAERFLGRAIESILAQTLAPYEIIVVDDGSTDATAAVAQSYGDKVKLIRQANQGVASARNTGILAAKGNQIALLDSDDVWLPHRLALQWKLMSAAPFPEMVFGTVEQVDDVSGDFLSQQPGTNATCLLARSSVFDRVGLYRTDLPSGEFIDWYARAMESGIRTAAVADVVAQRRQRRDSMMGANPDAVRAYLKVLHQSLERRRK